MDANWQWPSPSTSTICSVGRAIAGSTLVLAGTNSSGSAGRVTSQTVRRLSATYRRRTRRWSLPGAARTVTSTYGEASLAEGMVGVSAEELEGLAAEVAAGWLVSG